MPILSGEPYNVLDKNTVKLSSTSSFQSWLHEFLPHVRAVISIKISNHWTEFQLLFSLTAAWIEFLLPATIKTEQRSNKAHPQRPEPARTKQAVSQTFQQAIIYLNPFPHVSQTIPTKLVVKRYKILSQLWLINQSINRNKRNRIPRRPRRPNPLGSWMEFRAIDKHIQSVPGRRRRVHTPTPTDRSGRVAPVSDEWVHPRPRNNSKRNAVPPVDIEMKRLTWTRDKAPTPPPCPEHVLNTKLFYQVARSVVVGLRRPTMYWLTGVSLIRSPHHYGIRKNLTQSLLSTQLNDLCFRWLWSRVGGENARVGNCDRM